MSCVRALVGGTFLLLILAGGVLAGWWWGPEAYSRLRERAGLGTLPAEDGPLPTPELADSVLIRVQEFRQVGEGRMALGGREVTSLLRYSLPGLIPSGIRDPEVRLREGRLFLSAQVVMGAFPQLPDLGPVLGILPDTLDVVVEASLMPFGEEGAALVVYGLEASRIPIPRRLIPEILEAMGRADRPGLPLEAMAIPLPAGLTSAYILSDSIVLSTAP